MKEMITVVLIVLCGTPAISMSATCSCAGVPLINSLDSSATDSGKLMVSLSVETHEINDLVSGSDDVNDETQRQRVSQSQILSINYGLSESWSISALFSRVKHERKIGISQFSKRSASGIGDGVILAKYSVLRITPFTSNELVLGFGARVPIGEDEATSRDIILSEDMQPGTGAYGWILWSSYSHAFDQAAKFQFFSTSSYTFNEDNKREYSFGDEFTIALGLLYQSERKLAYSGLFRYRTTRADERSSFKIPNTGGEWVDFVPSIQYNVNDKLGLKLSARFPVARHLSGALQFTTSFAYTLTASYAF